MPGNETDDQVKSCGVVEIDPLTAERRLMLGGYWLKLTDTQIEEFQEQLSKRYGEGLREVECMPGELTPMAGLPAAVKSRNGIA